jgi:hypothetical protein
MDCPFCDPPRDRVFYEDELCSACGMRAARRDSLGWSQLVTTVAGTVEEMPLWKLQIVGGNPEEFLYRADTYSNRQILLEPGVAHCFRSFHSFIVNMVRGAWVDHLLRIRANQELVGEQGDLSKFLFGSERRPLDEFRAIFRDHQANRCFYCEQRVTGNGALDHFIPWVRYPVDLGHNFVFAHSGCNRYKRDCLAHPEHLARWREQNLDCANQLGKRFDNVVLPHDADRTRRIAHWAYEQAELGRARVWVAVDKFESLSKAWRVALYATKIIAGLKGGSINADIDRKITSDSLPGARGESDRLPNGYSSHEYKKNT